MFDGMKERLLHGWVKRFWVFLIATSVVAFIANIGTQILIEGNVDYSRALTLAFTIGFVLSVVMVFQFRTSGS
jgi:hypothetical protein